MLNRGHLCIAPTNDNSSLDGSVDMGYYPRHDLVHVANVHLLFRQARDGEVAICDDVERSALTIDLGAPVAAATGALSFPQSLSSSHQEADPCKHQSESVFSAAASSAAASPSAYWQKSHTSTASIIPSTPSPCARSLPSVPRESPARC
uniref:Uncharacterized protein n=1 Tax=mine drainage metagenome TaxID=410659 RepID=E6PHN4_9ZZZZ